MDGSIGRKMPAMQFPQDGDSVDISRLGDRERRAAQGATSKGADLIH